MSNDNTCRRLAVGLGVILTAFSVVVMAQPRGTWSVGVGAGWVIPKSNNGDLDSGARARVGNDIKPIFTLEYFVLDNVGVQLLGAIPFTQKVQVDGQHVGEVTHLPPALYLQYHFTRIPGPVTPFIGAGVEYSIIFNEDTDKDFKASAGRLRVSNSWGVTAHVGADYAITDSNAIRFDVYFIDIDSNVRVGGNYAGRTHIDPLVWGLSYLWRF